MRDPIHNMYFSKNGYGGGKGKRIHLLNECSYKINVIFDAKHI